MKTKFIKIILVVLIAIMDISCNKSPQAKAQDLEEAQEDVIDAEADLATSTQDSIRDFELYKASIEKKLAENQKLIANLKAKNNASDLSTRAAYLKELHNLELKNADLKLKIDQYKMGPEQKWELFKVEFNNDMDDLGKSISAMAERNSKK